MLPKRQHANRPSRALARVHVTRRRPRGPTLRRRGRLFLAASGRLPATTLLLPRHLRAGSAGFGQADRDRLLAARHLLARAAAAQRAGFALLHHLLHFGRSLPAVFPRHGFDLLCRRREAPAPRNSLTAL